jgi:hypothetical protein
MRFMQDISPELDKQADTQCVKYAVKILYFYFVLPSACITSYLVTM